MKKTYENYLALVEEALKAAVPLPEEKARDRACGKPCATASFWGESGCALCWFWLSPSSAAGTPGRPFPLHVPWRWSTPTPGPR